MGVGATMLGSVAPCMCYFPWFIGFPMACFGLYKATQARSSQLSPTGQSVATVALIANIVGAIIGSLFAMVIALYVVYFVVVMLAIGVGAASGNNF